MGAKPTLQVVIQALIWTDRNVNVRADVLAIGEAERSLHAFPGLSQKRLVW